MPQVDTWYRVTLTVDDEMGHTINVTKRDDAAVQATFRIPAGVMDKDKSWKFWHYTGTGTIYLDNYNEYTAATNFAYDPSGQRTLTMEPGRATTECVNDFETI